MTESKPITVTDDDFDSEVLEGEGISIVDFWAPWCGPCHTMAPGLEAFAEENAGRVKVFKLDVDDNPKVAEEYEIRSIPTVIFFKDGDEVEKNVGAMSQASLQSKLEDILKS
jgi:thioredoxin 1